MTRIKRNALTCQVLALSLSVLLSAVEADDRAKRVEAAARVDFSRDVAPILATHCFQCHGPDKAAREADLRLDEPRSFIASADGSDEAIVHPGSLALSVLYQRITSHRDDRMPPAEHGPALPASSIATIRQWIESGAAAQRHWAFVPPQRPLVPDVANLETTSPIDHFIVRQLEKNGLRLSPTAPPHQRFRRLCLDLTGLPPTIKQLETFLRDTRPDAWVHAVDRLLSSPRFGERQAQDWLDLARYADTTGHAADKPRTMWLFRDWVIDAINQNRPFDQFSIAQLAGDLLPAPDEQALIATGFHRNSMQALGNNPRKEEFRVKGIVDRLDTTGRVWLGLTIACAECHVHKYDPISQEEYYRLFAVFNNVPHLGERFDVHGPRIQVTAPHDRRLLNRLKGELRQLQDSSNRSGRLSQRRILEMLTEDAVDLTELQAPVISARFPGRVVVQDANREVLPTKPTSFPVDKFQPGPTAHLGSVHFEQSPILVAEQHAPNVTGDLSIGLWVRTTNDVADLVSKYDWKSGQRAFVFGVGGQRESGSRPGGLYAWISRRREPFDGVTVYGSQKINDGKWHHVALRFAAGRSIELFVDGKLDGAAKVDGKPPTSIAVNTLPLVIGGGFNKSRTPNFAFLSGHIADVRIFDRALSIQQLGLFDAELQTRVADYLSSPPDSQIPADLAALADEIQRSIPTAGTQRERSLKERIARLEAAKVTAQVMSELPKPRTTHIHIRGNFERPGKQVETGIPTVLGWSNTNAPVSRLNFARQLFSRSNPLTARVTVNRIWAHYFGRGLVTTVDDFGLRSDYPTHPELLDWLAVEFIESGWNTKHIHRLIVTSTVYQQSSNSTPELNRLDPHNRLLARASRKRLPAEQVRDMALFVSGQLVEQIGGPSVFPPQPEGVGLYRDNTAGKWKSEAGSGKYRRSLYTFWQRMSPYPLLTTMDAPSRERCTVGRSTTNTPLQALATMNDVQFAKLARDLGHRIEAFGGSVEQRIRHGFLLVLSRPPNPAELELYTRFVGTSDDAQTWYRVSQVLLNLDEALTRE